MTRVPARRTLSGAAVSAPSSAPSPTPNPPPAPAPASAPTPSTLVAVAPLTNSTVRIPKATYVPLKAAQSTSDVGGAVRKSSFAKSLALQTGEVDAVHSALSVVAAANQPADSLLVLLRQLEGETLPAQQPPASAFANITSADLTAFGNALVAVRRQALTRATTGTTADAAQSVANATDALNTALVSNAGFSGGSLISPIGMLNLERMEMTPAGIERGGLIATIPLAPKERTTVVQQEWSVISQDFTSVVTDSLANFSATGVTDATQLAQSTKSQVAHSNQLNINASVSGGVGFVTGSVSTAFISQDQNSQSAEDSRKHAIQTTRQAASRSTESHKMTISTTTTSGTSESTTRMLENPSATDPMRIDYFSIMRKWYVALYRYGLRLTYDITVPEPGAAMREAYRQIALLQAQAAKGFSFDLKYADITASSYLTLASQYGAQVSPPPQNSALVAGGNEVTMSDVSSPGNFTDWPIQFAVPDGYQIDEIALNAHIGDNHASDNPNGLNGYSFGIVGLPYTFDEHGGGAQEWITNASLGNFMKGYTGQVTVTCVFRYANPAVVTLFVKLVPTAASLEQWQASAYTALYNAAQTTFYNDQQNANAQITALQQQLTSVDTLTLRREENDEIMKSALRWLLGPKFEFMPTSVINLFKQQSGADLQYGIDFTGNESNLSNSSWTVVNQNEDRVNFINQAIDWDNVNFFVYSYFWDVPESWDFIRQIQHPDATRQAFLRAGSARIVLTVRPGWEVAWTYFVEFGSTTMPDPLPSHPYLTIAQQIEDYDAINYPGIPPANPDGGGPIDDGTPQIGTTCDVNLSPGVSPVSITVADSTGFVAGATAIIDTWESGVQESQTITAVPDGTHITVASLSNAHSPTQNQNIAFPIVQAGELGLLIAEWFEYTPTSGTDIAVTSNLATIT